jgi:hypothetical protein
MVLNQTQRDRAIQMIKNAVSAKRELISIKCLSEKDFIEEHIKTAKIKSLTIAQLRNGLSEDRWSGYNFKPIKAFGVEDAFNLHQRDVADTNKDICAKLNELEKQLIGEVMFGTDYSVIAAALKAVENYK